MHKIIITIYFIIIFSLMVGAYINSIQPTEIAYAKSPYGTHEQYERMFVIKIDWTQERIEQEIRANLPEVFVKIAECESGLVPQAHNTKTGDHGLLQANEHYWGDWYTKEGLDPYNVEDAIKIAQHIYKVQGLSAWSATRSCWSK